jgi:hypothetical protein
VAVTPASVPLDEDTPPSPELLDFDTEKFLMGIDLSPGPEEDFSEEDLNAFVITSPKRKRAVSGGGDATEARLNTTATPSAAQAFLHSDHPPQSLAQSAGAAVTGESENAAPAAVAAVTELMNLNDKLECVTGGADLQAIPFRQVSLLEKAWKRGGLLVDPTRTDAGEIENANTLKKPLTHAAPRPVMFAPAEEDELIGKHVHISEENGPPSRGQIMERKKVGECFKFEGKSYPIKAGLFKTSVGFSLKVFFQPLPLNTNPA